MSSLTTFESFSVDVPFNLIAYSLERGVVRRILTKLHKDIDDRVVCTYNLILVSIGHCASKAAQTVIVDVLVLVLDMGQVVFGVSRVLGSTDARPGAVRWRERLYGGSVQDGCLGKTPSFVSSNNKWSGCLRIQFHYNEFLTRITLS